LYGKIGFLIQFYYNSRMPVPTFKKHVVGTIENAVGSGQMNTLGIVGDVNGDGRPDIVISGRYGRMVWLENPGHAESPWPVHRIGEFEKIECGGSFFDLDGDGFLDIVNGSESKNDEIFWWQNPGNSSREWVKRLILKTGHGQFHDTLICDALNTGAPCLVFTNQHGGSTIYCIPLPRDPTISPWPGAQIIASGKWEPNPRHRWNPAGEQPEEGLACGDIDGDGKNEIICGTHWYKFENGVWRGHRFARGYLTTKCVIADIDSDGANEILLAEGDPVVYGVPEGGRLSWFKPGKDITALWEEHVIDSGLLDAHSLVVGDHCTNGKPDLFVAEIGEAGANDDYVRFPPRLMIYENHGGAAGFTRHIIDEGTGTHEAVMVDMFGRGKLDIVGKPLHGPNKWDVHIWVRE
jgi:hypothetical protein